MQLNQGIYRQLALRVFCFSLHRKMGTLKQRQRWLFKRTGLVINRIVITLIR